LDANGDTQDTTWEPIRIQAVADLPYVDVTSPAALVVDAGQATVPLNITVGHSDDDDGSEYLTVEIAVPDPDGFGAAMGTITATNTPAGISMSSAVQRDIDGKPYYVYTVTTDTFTNAADQEALLNSFLCCNNLVLDPRENYVGSLNETNGLLVSVISTESATGDELAPDSYGGADGTSKTETATAVIAMTIVAVPGVPLSFGVEDEGPFAFGADLANRTHGIVLENNGTSDPDTISQVVVTLPEDSANMTYALTGTRVPSTPGTITGEGSAFVTYNDVDRTYTITSSIITGAADLSALTPAERQQAEDDIRDTLATFVIEIGPEHQASNGAVTVTVTSLDANGDTQDTTWEPIRMQVKYLTMSTLFVGLAVCLSLSRPSHTNLCSCQ
jgi:hypothetical protein